MLSIRPYYETTACIQEKELLTHIVETTGITKLWLSTDHVFLATSTDRVLYVFDIIPQLKWRRSVPSKPKDCILNTNQEHTIEVVWQKSEPSFVYVVSESGTTGIWEFLRPSNEWTQHKTFQLSNAKGARIIDVKLHEGTGNIVWCESRGVGEGTFCVCCRTFTSNSKDENCKTELGTTQAILHNCPAIQFFSFGDGICIHPDQIYLEKFCIFWSGRKDLKAVVFKDGKVEESTNCSSDFRDIATVLIGSWSTNVDDSSLNIVGMTVHPSSDNFLLLNYNGMVTKVFMKSNQVKTIPVCKIQLPPSIVQHMKNIKVFTNELKFGLVDQYGVAFLYDIVSGKLLYKFEELSRTLEQYNILNSCSAVPITVFWDTNHFWKLEFPALNNLVKAVTGSSSSFNTGNKEYTLASDINETDKNKMNVEVGCKTEDISTTEELNQIPSLEETGLIDIALWFSIFGLDHSAAVLILDNIVTQLGARMKFPKTVVNFLQKLCNKVFQSPALLLALCDNQLSLEDENLANLKHFLEEFDQGVVPSSYVTPLNVQIQPFLHELFNVMSRLRNMSSVEFSKLKDVFGETPGVVVGKALDSALSGAPDSNSLDKLEILSLQEPEDLVKGFLPVNREHFAMESPDGSGKVCEVLREELKDRRWRRHNPDNNIVLRALFKLLYKYHPERLIDFLEISKICVSQGASKDETTIKDLEECIRDFMLDFLPSVWSEECDLNRIKIHSDLLVRLELQHDAIQLLIHRQQWQKAVDLYIELSHRSTDQRLTSQLYVMLLAGILRGSGTSEKQLVIKLFELKPQIFQLHDLFQLCFTNVPGHVAEAILDEHALTVKETRKALEQFLPKT